MKLFKNGVGRPSNETLRKRKLFKLGMVFVIIILICASFSLGYFNIINLRGYAAKDKVTLCENTKIYITEKSKISYKAEGTYYVWGSTVLNERIKITKKEKYAGKRGLAVGWVELSSLSSCLAQTTVYKKGDVNRNGKVEASDALVVLQYVVGIKKLDDNQFNLADINDDGKVDAADSRRILKLVVGIADEPEEPKENVITMTELQKTWNVGESNTVGVTLKDSSDSFTADSSKPNVMQISNKNSKSFKLTALSPGTSKITVTSNKTGQSVSYEYTVQKTSDLSSNDLTIDVSFDGELNSNNIYMFDTTGKKNLTVTFKNDTGEKRYYRWFLYSGKLDSNGKVSSTGLPYHVSACTSYDKTLTKTAESELTTNAPLKVITVRNYLNDSQCKEDKIADKTTFINEKKANYGLKSALVNITVSPEGTANSEGVVLVSEEKKYATTVSFKNFTTKKLYYRWFTYNSYDTSKNPSWNEGGCIELTNSAAEKWNITMSSANPKRAGKVKVYSSLSSCKADNNSASNSNVIVSKNVKYGLTKVYTSSNGFKMIWYNHAGLSKEVGTQLDGKCARAAWAHGAYILSNGKYVFKSKNIAYPTMGATAVKSFNAKGVYDLIIAKIDRGIPVMIQVYNNHYSSHWVTVVGYRVSKNSSNMGLSDIYIVDPWYADGMYNIFDVTLWRGIASNRTVSVKGLHTDYMPRTWDNASDLDQSTAVKNNMK